MSALRDRWPADLKRAFDHFAPAAVYVAGPREIIPRYMGDNMGGRPIRIGRTGSFKDTISSSLNSASPYWWQGVLFRVWLRHEVDAVILADHLPGLVAERGGKARPGWLDLGVEADIDILELEAHDLARRLKMQAWDDDGLIDELNRIRRRDAMRMRR